MAEWPERASRSASPRRPIIPRLHTQPGYTTMGAVAKLNRDASPTQHPHRQVRTHHRRAKRRPLRGNHAGARPRQPHLRCPPSVRWRSWSTTSQWTVSSELSLELTTASASAVAAHPDVPIVGAAQPVGAKHAFAAELPPPVSRWWPRQLRQFFAGNQSRYVGTALRTGRRSGVAEAQAIGADGEVPSSRG